MNDDNASSPAFLFLVFLLGVSLGFVAILVLLEYAAR